MTPNGRFFRDLNGKLAFWAPYNFPALEAMDYFLYEPFQCI